MKLVIPTVEHKIAYMAMIDDYKKRDAIIDKHFLENSFDYDDFIKYVQKRMIDEKMPQFQWLLIDGDSIIGTVRLRPKLEGDDETNEHGHIGYDITPSYRGYGYGKIILKLALEEAKCRGMKKVLVTCAIDNIASQKIIEYNGGQFDKIVLGEDGQVRRYWILI